MELDHQLADNAVGESDWELRHDEASSAAFYYNLRTGEATWDDPTNLQEVHVAGRPQQWTEAQDESGRVYYVNLHTMETSWEVPETTAAAAPVSPAANASLVRPSTAEQMDRLNRLLSGDDDDEDGDNGSGDSGHADASLGIVSSDNGPDEAQSLAEQFERSGATAHAFQPEEMPWMMFINEGDGLPYYYNHLTGECVWEPPEAFVQYHEQQEAHEAAVAPSGLVVEMEPITSSATDMKGSAFADAKDQDVEFSEDVSNFEEKVRRAIDAVSKTPVESSRLLLVRTPTERLSSRPGSRPASGDGSSRIRRASVDPAADLVDIPSAEAIDTESRSASYLSVSEPELIDSSYAVSSTDDGVSAPETSGDMATTDFAIAVFVEEAAVVLQCLVRCFLARHRLQQKRQERDARLKQTSINNTANQSKPQPSSEVITADEVSSLQYEEQPDERIASGDTLISPEPEIPMDAKKETDNQSEQQLPDGVGKSTNTLVDLNVAGDAVISSLEPENVVTVDESSILSASVENDLEANTHMWLDREYAVTSDKVMPLKELQPVAVDAGDVQTTTGMVLLPDHDETSKAEDLNDTVRASGVDELKVLNQKDSAALILQCAVRCFVARHRVARKRQFQTRNASEIDPKVEKMEATVSNVSFAPNIINHIDQKEEQPAVSADIPDKSAMILDINPTEAATTDVSNDSVTLNVGINDVEVITTVAKPLAPSTSKPSRPSTSASSPSSRAKSRESERTVRSQTSSTHLTTPPKKPSVLDLAQYFPARPSRATKEINAPRRETTNSNQLSSGIPRKKITEYLTSEVVQMTADEKSAQRERRKQERELLAAQTREKWAKEVEECRLIFQNSASKFQEQRQKLLEAAEAEQQKQPLELLESRDLARDLETEADQKQSMWNSTRNGMPSVSGSLEQFSADLNEALSRETFISTMKQVRFAEVVDREHQLQTTSQRLDAQLELIDVYLVTDDPEITMPLKSFQAKYAKILRKRQQDTRRALRFWQERIDEFQLSALDDSDHILHEAESKHLWQHRFNTHWKSLSSDDQRSRVVHDLRFGNGDSLLHFVVWKGWAAHVAQLISLGWDVNAVDNSVSRWAPLHEACRAGHVEVCERLLSAGARLDAVDSMGDTPLHVASRMGWLKVVQVLLSAAERTDECVERRHTARSNADNKRDAPASMHCSLSEFYYLRNRKHRRAIDLIKKQTLWEYFEGKLAI